MFVLPKIPSFGERFAGQLTGNLSKGLDTASQLVRDVAKQQAKRGPTIAETLSSFRNTQSPSVTQNLEGNTPESIANEPQAMLDSLDPIQKAMIAEAHPEAYKSLFSKEKEEEKQMKESMSENLDRLEYLATSKRGFGSKAMEEREELNSLGLWVTDKAFTHFNKGTLSDSKLKMMQEKMTPRLGLRPEQNKARINSLKRIMKLKPNTDPKTVNKIVDEEEKKLEKYNRPSLESFYG